MWVKNRRSFYAPSTSTMKHTADGVWILFWYGILTALLSYSSSASIFFVAFLHVGFWCPRVPNQDYERYRVIGEITKLADVTYASKWTLNSGVDKISQRREDNRRDDDVTGRNSQVCSRTFSSCSLFFFFLSVMLQSSLLLAVPFFLILWNYWWRDSNWFTISQLLSHSVMSWRLAFSVLLLCENNVVDKGWRRRLRKMVMEVCWRDCRRSLVEGFT